MKHVALVDFHQPTTWARTTWARTTWVEDALTQLSVPRAAPGWRLLFGDQPLLALTIGMACWAWLSTLSSLSLAQRVQFPSNVPFAAGPNSTSSPFGSYPSTLPPSAAYPSYPSTPSFGVPSMPTFDPYGSGPLSPPPLETPYVPSGVPSGPAYGAPHYGYPAPQGPAGGSLFSRGPHTSPFPNQAYPNQPGGMFPNGAPVGWESGGYQWQNSDGSWARLQRLLQQLSFEHTWLAGEHRPEELEINRTELAATFGVPVFYNSDTPLLVTPGFAFNWLKGPLSDGTPTSPDLPAQLYDAYLDAAWHPKITDWLHADLGFRTGVWTDFKEINGDSVRYLGRGLGVLAFSPRLDLLAGVWYLDRNKIALLPAGGLHWRPTNEWDAYIVFPNPKVRRRFVNVGTSQWWWYFAGEYGGGRWTLERADGRPDDVDINDIRVIFGFEWETQTQAHGHIEVGYVWEREIIYDLTRSPGRLPLDDTVMVRGGFDF